MNNLTVFAPARKTVMHALNLGDLIADRGIILGIEEGDYFKGAWCEHDDCAHPAATSLAWVDREDGLTEQFVCGDHTADALTVVRMSEDTDPSEDITVRVSPYWLLYVHEIAA